MVSKKLKMLSMIIALVVIALCAVVIVQSPKKGQMGEVDQSKEIEANYLQNETEVEGSTFAIYGPQGEAMILDRVPIDIKEGQTVLDVSLEVFKKNKLQFEYSGTGGTAYIEGIDNLYEFDKGPESGWLYRVNGEFPNKSCGAYKLKRGDKIEWMYTLDLGKDVGSGEGGLNTQKE